jgi:hypothetical protein
MKIRPSKCSDFFGFYVLILFKTIDDIYIQKTKKAVMHDEIKFRHGVKFVGKGGKVFISPT